MAEGEGEFGINHDESCVICATVTMGLEEISARECEKKLRCSVWLGEVEFTLKFRAET